MPDYEDQFFLAFKAGAEYTADAGDYWTDEDLWVMYQQWINEDD